MGFTIINKRNRSSFIPGGNNYHKLKSIEDLSCLIDKEKRYSSGSNYELKMPAHSTYNKRFSEQSFNSLSNVSIADTYYSTSSVTSSDINDIYSCYQPGSSNNENYIVNGVEPVNKKQKKHRKRKALSKIFQSFSINDQLQQSMQCPDWEYYCNKENMYNLNTY